MSDQETPQTPAKAPLTVERLLTPFGSGAYTGVGSRKTTPEALALMTALAEGLARAGWVLRSGGADGADKAFEAGADQGNPEPGARVPFHKQVFIPWRKFNGSDSQLVGAMPAADDIIQRIHPAYSKLTQGAKKLHARNVHQVLGPALHTPSEFLVAYTEGGKDIGGTRTAIVLAREHGIPVFNLGLARDMEFIQQVVAALKASPAATRKPGP